MTPILTSGAGRDHPRHRNRPRRGGQRHPHPAGLLPAAAPSQPHDEIDWVGGYLYDVPGPVAD
jgi:hypothetical protein